MRNRGVILGIILAAVLLALLNLPAPLSLRVKAVLRDAVAPLQRGVTRAVRTLVEGGRAVRGFGGLLRENQAMAAELLHLRNQVRELRALDGENQELRRQLGFQRASARRLVAGEVIGRDIAGWWQTLRLNKGAEDGIAPDLAVVTSDGLLGRTIAASERTCDVLLLSDPVCRVAARVNPSGAFGLVEGTGPARAGQTVCRMRFVHRNRPVKPGDQVVTSGLGGIFPPGLLIGYVETVETDESGLYQTATVVAQADVGGALYAFVVLPQEKGARP